MSSYCNVTLMNIVPVIQVSTPTVLRFPCWTSYPNSTGAECPLLFVLRKVPQYHSTASGMDGLHAALARTLYALHVCVVHVSSPAVGSQSVLVCMLVVFAAICVCVFLQHAPSINEATVKRHRSAPFWMSPRSSSQVSLDHWASWWPGGAGLAEPVGCCALTWPSPVCHSIWYQPQCSVILHLLCAIRKSLFKKKYIYI